MAKVRKFVFALALAVGSCGDVHAHLCDNVFRQADKLIVKPEVYNLIVKDKLTFKIFLQNNMDRGIAEISLIGDSSVFDIVANPRKMSVPKGQRAFFEVTLTPKPETRTGNYPVNFRLVGDGRLFKSFSITAGGQASAGNAVPSDASSNWVTAPAVSSFNTQAIQAKAGTRGGTVRFSELEGGVARSSTRMVPASSNPPPVLASDNASRHGRVPEPTPRPPVKEGGDGKESLRKGTVEPAVSQPDLPVKLKYSLEVHAASAVPDIDGVINDPAWKSAAVLANFSSVDGGQAVYDTTGLLLRDARNLVMGFYCSDENAEALTEQDGLEIQLTKHASGRPAYTMFLSPTGKVRLKQQLPDDQTTVWPASGIRYVVRKEKQSWTAEIVIPFSALNVRATAIPPQWYLRVIRTKASGHAEKSYWAPDASGYNSKKGFGAFTLVP